MLKNRLIPCVVLQNEMVVQSFGFERFLPIGKIDAVVEFFMNWDVDEIVILDTTATRESRTLSSELIERVAKNCFVPLSVGGGIKSFESVIALLKAGADKVVLNSPIVEDPSFVSKVSKKYGRQFVTASIDAKLVNSEYKTYIHNGKVDTGKTVLELAKHAESIGAGEIFLNSIDRDGSRLGYDLDLLKLVSSNVKIPVIACGGVGKAGDLPEGITKGKCQAVSAANIFNHTELSTVAGKALMRSKGIPIRVDSAVSYQEFSFDHLDRPI